MIRILDRDEALTLLRLAKKHHEEGKPLPPQIEEKKREITAAIKNAELFIACFRVVDWGMVDDITRMKLELDGLYAGWVASETPRTIH